MQKITFRTTKYNRTAAQYVLNWLLLAADLKHPHGLLSSTLSDRVSAGYLLGIYLVMED